MSAIDRLLDDIFSDDLPDTSQFKLPPAEFLETFVYDPERDEPLRLVDEQRKVITEMTRKDAGRFVYDTLVYSAPKKSGKTTLCAGVVLWQAWQVDRGACYIIGNDLKQADSRMFRVIEYAVKNHPVMRQFAEVNRYRITLANGTIIEAIPVDPAGEAGANPTCIAWTETWGAKHEKHNLLWAEMALSPTRPGEGFILVESYAGHVGESKILENLYEHGVKEGVEIDTELYVNRRQITYWCTRRDLPWQVSNPEYYESEAAKLPPSEYDRVHGNKWVNSVSSFVDQTSWDLCKGEVPPLQTGEPMVIALDAAVTNDCFAIVGVSRRGNQLIKRLCKIWTPPPNGQIDFLEIEKYLYDEETAEGLLTQHNVASLTYDPYQLARTAQYLREQNIVRMDLFSQQGARAIADNNLQKIIMTRQLTHDGDPDLTAHIMNTAAETEGENKLRLVKKNQQSKIDAAVALSMACEIAMYLNISYEDLL